MKAENRKRLRDALVGKTIKDVLFQDQYGLIVEVILEDDTKISMMTFPDHADHHGDFYVGLNEEEI